MGKKLTFEVACEIEKYLDEHNVWAEVSLYEDFAIAVEISWGDWKHDHLRTEWLMREFGYIPVSEKVTEENGSDTYSAIHYFVKK